MHISWVVLQILKLPPNEDVNYLEQSAYDPQAPWSLRIDDGNPCDTTPHPVTSSSTNHTNLCMSWSHTLQPTTPTRNQALKNALLKPLREFGILEHYSLILLVLVPLQ